MNENKFLFYVKKYTSLQSFFIQLFIHYFYSGATYIPTNNRKNTLDKISSNVIFNIINFPVVFIHHSQVQYIYTSFQPW